MINRLLNLYRRYFWSIEKQARYAKVNIGKNCFFASRFWSKEAYLITIGDNCQITEGVKIFTHGGGGAVRNKFQKFDTFGRVVVGDYVYIGNNSLIMPGVTIGDNVLIGAGSLVTKSIPSNVVVGGNPAKIICSLDDYIRRNMCYNVESKGMSAEEKRDYLLSLPEEKFIQKRCMTY